jgi:hypothetical protein
MTSIIPVHPIFFSCFPSFSTQKFPTAQAMHHFLAAPRVQLCKARDSSYGLREVKSHGKTTDFSAGEELFSLSKNFEENMTIPNQNKSLQKNEMYLGKHGVHHHPSTIHIIVCICIYIYPFEIFSRVDRFS